MWSPDQTGRGNHKEGGGRIPVSELRSSFLRFSQLQHIIYLDQLSFYQSHTSRPRVNLSRLKQWQKCTPRAPLPFLSHPYIHTTNELVSAFAKSQSQRHHLDLGGSMYRHNRNIDNNRKWHTKGRKCVLDGITDSTINILYVYTLETLPLFHSSSSSHYFPLNLGFRSLHVYVMWVMEICLL